MQQLFLRCLALMITVLFIAPASADYTDELLIKELVSQTRHLEKPVLKKALTAFNNAQAAGLTDSTLFTVIDYSKPSNKPRLWVLDLEYGELLYEELVSHGQGSGELYARKFSNTPESHQSSLGLFITEEPYYGRNGYSLRLDGLEEGINHLAKPRAIVIHGADYVTPDFIRKHGRLGRSHGCPAVSEAVNRELINTIKGGSLVFVYYPERTWLAQSEFLQNDLDMDIRLSKLML